jgi:hypothetical protein
LFEQGMHSPVVADSAIQVSQKRMQFEEVVK